MGNVYAAVFNNKIVKFGRSSNVLRRIRDHNTLGHHHGASVTKVFISPVSNELREEKIILDIADESLDSVSHESFKFDTLLDVKRVFDDARLEFIMFNVRERPFELVLLDYDSNTDFESMGWERKKLEKPAKRNVVCDEVLGCFKRYDKLRFHEVRSMLANRKPIAITTAIHQLLNSGELQVKYWKDPFTDYVSSDIKRATLMKVEGNRG